MPASHSQLVSTFPLWEQNSKPSSARVRIVPSWNANSETDRSRIHSWKLMYADPAPTANRLGSQPVPCGPSRRIACDSGSFIGAKLRQVRHRLPSPRPSGNQPSGRFHKRTSWERTCDYLKQIVYCVYLWSLGHDNLNSVALLWYAWKLTPSFKPLFKKVMNKQTVGVECLSKSPWRVHTGVSFSVLQTGP